MGLKKVEEGRGEEDERENKQKEFGSKIPGEKGERKVNEAKAGDETDGVKKTETNSSRD